MVGRRRRISVLAGGVAGLLCAATISGIAGATAGVRGPRRPEAAGRVHDHGLCPEASRGRRLEVRRGELRGGAEAAGRGGAQALVTGDQHAGQCQLPALPHRGAVGSPVLASAGQVNQARRWLASEGSRSARWPGTGSPSAASGSAAQVEKAFGTTLRKYRVNGKAFAWPTSNVGAGSLAGTVVGALGINQTVATTNAVGNRGQPRADGPPVRRELERRTSSRPPRRRSSPPRRAASTTGRVQTTVQPPFGKGYSADGAGPGVRLPAARSSARPTTSDRATRGRVSR